MIGKLTWLTKTFLYIDNEIFTLTLDNSLLEISSSVVSNTKKIKHKDIKR